MFNVQLHQSSVTKFGDTNSGLWPTFPDEPIAID